METPRIMRDCLENILRNGSSSEIAYRDAYLLAKEFKRLGYSRDRAIGELQTWAEACEPPLQGSSLNSAKRTVVKELEKNDPPLSCAPDRCLVKQGYCFLRGATDTSCAFHNTVKTICNFLRSRQLSEDGWDAWEIWFRDRLATWGNTAFISIAH